MARPFPMALIIATAALLSGCNKMPEPPLDYCEDQQRKIPADERIVNALISMEKRSLYRFKLKHYSEFRERKLADRPEIPAEELAATYYKENPDCCEFQLPWAFEYYPRYGDTEFSDEQVAHARKIKWTHNVIVSDPPGQQIPFADKDIRDGELTDPIYRRVVIKSYACGETEGTKNV